MRNLIFFLLMLFSLNLIFSGEIIAQEKPNSILSVMKKRNNLVAFWDFGDTTGKPIGGTAKNIKLLPFKKPKYSNEGPISGRSISLDGKSDYWYIQHDKSSGLDIKTNAVTVIAWVKWSGETGFVAGKWNESENGGKRQYGLFVSLPHYNGASKVCGHISKNGGATPPFPYSIDYSASPQKVETNIWTCIAFTYDGKYIKSYWNGEYKSSEPELINNTKGFLTNQPNGLTQVKNPYYYLDGMGNNGSDFTVGGVQLKKGMGNFFKGEIGGIAVFNSALTQAEILKISNTANIK
ncbi:LamG domain-containing protein [Pedobacter mucosus]|uniref:LamG domain-containing protein n=1 Tax=Pedobacter mucosus TaxID=2895286 RepID=UPI001EE3ABEF|nr:LamG domain-containing protein [Pedobacter mucosus]UKT64944.1 LamG domain-containing protein [Pedobacter mucosus]